MTKLSKKQLLSLARELGALDLTSVNPRDIAFPVYRDVIAYSDGVNGVSGVLVRDDKGHFYYTRSHCTNNYILM